MSRTGVVARVSNAAACNVMYCQMSLVAAPEKRWMPARAASRCTIASCTSNSGPAATSCSVIVEQSRMQAHSVIPLTVLALFIPYWIACHGHLR
eukprot:scaffold114790_cov63-Phaeocystis_antarctica.AAC.1